MPLSISQPCPPQLLTGLCFLPNRLILDPGGRSYCTYTAVHGSRIRLTGEGEWPRLALSHLGSSDNRQEGLDLIARRSVSALFHPVGKLTASADSCPHMPPRAAAAVGRSAERHRSAGFAPPASFEVWIVRDTYGLELCKWGGDWRGARSSMLALVSFLLTATFAALCRNPPVPLSI